MFFTFLAVFTFCSLNAVASELEDPFGHDANDLPLRSLHRNFVYVLIQLTNSKLTKTDLMSVTPEEQQVSQPLTAFFTRCPQTLVSEASPEDHPEAKALDDAAASLVDKMNQQVSASGGTVLHTEVCTFLHKLEAWWTHSMYAKALREMFNSLDKNGNAVLDHDELRTLCERLGLGFSDDKFGHMMKKLDPDSTGEVNLFNVTIVGLTMLRCHSTTF